MSSDHRNQNRMIFPTGLVFGYIGNEDDVPLWFASRLLKLGAKVNEVDDMGSVSFHRSVNKENSKYPNGKYCEQPHRSWYRAHLGPDTRANRFSQLASLKLFLNFEELPRQ